MTYFKIFENEYILMIGTGSGGTEITEQEYTEILSIIHATPQDAPEGYGYKLRADTLEWELVELPHVPEPEKEPTEEDKAAAYDIIVSGIQSKETPKPLEIAKKIKEIVDKYYKG